MNNIIDRIKKIIEYKGISERKFCTEIGVSNGFLNKVSDVGSSKLMKILNRYSEINPSWLLTGRGKMILDTMDNLEIDKESKSDKDYTEFLDNNYRVRRIVDLLDKDNLSGLYEDVAFFCFYIHHYTEHYSLDNKHDELKNEIDKKEIEKKVQQILNIEKELLKIIKPHYNAIYELYQKLSDFDSKHDKISTLDIDVSEILESELKDFPENLRKTISNVI